MNKYFLASAIIALVSPVAGAQAALYPTCNAGKVLSVGSGYIATGNSTTKITTDENGEPVETTIPGNQKVYPHSWAQLQCDTPSTDHDGNSKTGLMSETGIAVFFFNSKPDGLFELAKEALLSNKTISFSARSVKKPVDDNPENETPAIADDAVKFGRQIISLAIVGQQEI